MKEIKKLFIAVEKYQRKIINIDLSKEQGGLIFHKDCEIMIKEFENESSNNKQYIASFSKAILKDTITIGLWHTHEKPILPSFRDLFQIITLNIKYKKGFYLVIFTPKPIYIILWKNIFPVLKTLNRNNW